MTRKRRYLISAAVLAACVCIALGVLAMLPPRPGVTKASFDRIVIGMGKPDVEAILGIEIEENRFAWQGHDHSSVLLLFLNEKVAVKEWVDSPETFIDTLSRWLNPPRQRIRVL